jgi:hypothetical protein
MLKYHQAILDMLGLETNLATDRLASIEERERACRARFPASVREWFAVREADSLFHDNTNQDHLEKLDELGNQAEAAQGYLRVATENQAVVAWYVRLSAGDDPAVYHNNDEWNLDLSKTNWQPYSTTFTNFIFDAISSHYFGGWYSGMHLSAQDHLPDGAALAQLRQWFRQGPSTHTPDATVYRFFTRGGVVHIRSVTPGDLANRAAEWSIDADSPQTLTDFAQKIWGVGTLCRTLTARSSSPTSRAKGADILRCLRAEMPA